MKKLLALTLILVFSTAHAQTPRARRPRPRPNRPASSAVPAPGGTRTATPAIQTPVFLTRSGAATIREMMIQPPAFSYGSSINVWLLKDRLGRTREIAVTGHGDSATCRRVSGQVMTMFLEKNKEPEDLFVAGAAHLVDRGDSAKRKLLQEKASVKNFIEAQRQLWLTQMLVNLREDAPGEETDEQTSLGSARAELLALEQRVEGLRADPLVQEYLRESRSADAISEFVKEVKRFSRENGLVIVREIPLEPVEEARTRIAAAATSASAGVISFNDLLDDPDAPEAAMFTPVLTIPGGRPLELRIPLASLNVSTFQEARRNNRDDVEQAIIGNARQRLAIFNESKQVALRAQARCEKLSPAELREIVILNEVTTAEGVKTIADKPVKMTREEYCKIQVPLNLSIINEWIGRTKQLVKSVDADARRQDGSRIVEFNDTTLVDSMLRDWRLPVARSQAIFDAWRGAARGPVWNLLVAQLSRMGVATDILSGEQMVFSIRVAGPELVIRPLHVIDMARSVVVVDPAAGATRVVDAWSLRSMTSPAATSPAGDATGVRELVRDAVNQLAAGDREKASAQLAAAFSRDPGLAFREVEREWLGQFPDTRQRLLEMQRELRPIIEAIEWREGFENMKGSPTAKEDLREEIMSFMTFLESYPKAPVDLHLIFAIKLASNIAAFQNELDKQRPSALAAQPAQVTTWEVIEAHSQPEAGVGIGGNGLGWSSQRSKALAAARLKRRQQIEAYLRKRRYEGARLTKALNLWMNIESSEYSPSSAGPSRYIESRKILSSILLADPAPILRKTLQLVKERDPAYWAEARKAADLPKERSTVWEAAERATQRELTLFEAQAQVLARGEEGLRKSRWGAEAADYLWSTRNPNLRSLLSVIDAAVGDGGTGSSSAYVGPQQTVKLFLGQGKGMDTLTRAQNAASLQIGSETLLSIARSRISRDDIPEPFRDAIPLRARIWFESGDYLKALETMLAKAVPIALYSPGMSWESLPGDATQRPLAVKARQEGRRIVFEATFKGDKKADVLALNDLSAADAEALLKEFSKTSEQSWSEYGKVSDQILLTPIAIRPALSKLRELLLDPQLRLLLMKSMVYGRSAPGDEIVRLPQGATALDRTVAILDQVKGDQGRDYRVPSLDEVKQAAANKIRRKD